MQIVHHFEADDELHRSVTLSKRHSIITKSHKVNGHVPRLKTRDTPAALKIHTGILKSLISYLRIRKSRLL